jgi:protein-tyrosine phosphatase
MSGGATTVRLCFVCMGNICRSPTAAGVMRHHVAAAGLTGQIEIDSAGTGGWHAGELPDDRARAEARRRGVDIDDPARKFVAGDFDRFDLVLAMDHDNRHDLWALAGQADHRAKVRLLREFDPASPPDSVVPDPYYGEGDGFALVFDLVDAACRGLLDHVVERHGLTGP